MRRAALCLLLLLFLLPTAASGAGKSCEEMKHRLVYGGGAASGLFVLDAETGKQVSARAATRPRILASNTKLFTTATALSRFGPEYRIVTRLLTDGTIGLGGVLHGSLYLVGAGDPALGTPSFYRRFLGGLGTNIFRSSGRCAKPGSARSPAASTPTTASSTACAASPTPATRPAPEIGPLSGLSFDSGYSTRRAPAASPGSGADRGGDAGRGRCAQAGVRISPHGRPRHRPPFSTELARVESPPLSRSSTRPTSTPTTSSPRC